MTSEERAFHDFIVAEFERLRWALVGIGPEDVDVESIHNLIEFAKGNILGNMPFTPDNAEPSGTPPA